MSGEHGAATAAEGLAREIINLLDAADASVRECAFALIDVHVAFLWMLEKQGRPDLADRMLDTHATDVRASLQAARAGGDPANTPPPRRMH